ITITSDNTLDTLSVESVEESARRLTLLADAPNTAFVVNGAAITPLAKLATQPIKTTQSATSSQKQITDVSFAGSVAANVLYTVVL
ncbi:hypothetical protein JZU57_02715, partial [bacterium]|nr:hypothetical protein [bacterium]